MGKTQSRGTEFAALAGLLALLLAVFAAIACSLGASLRHAAFLSGWLLMALLLVLGLLPSKISGPRLHAALGVASIAFFAAHADFGLPEGGYEIFLAALFVLVAASGLVGRWGPDAEAESPPAPWRYVHVPLTWALLGFALLHGILMHAHGLLAAWWE